MTVKVRIPKALREAVWIKHMGKRFEHKCLTPWCSNRINTFDFHVSHGIPESKGGETTVDNLYPVCARCNLSMGSSYTFEEWKMFKQKSCCFLW